MWLSKLTVKKLFMGVDTGGRATQVTATADELNILDGATLTVAELNALDNSVNGALMAAGSGLSSAGAIKYGISRAGNIITTKIFIDLDGLHGGDTAADIIGNDGGAANCHFGQITAAINGTIYAGWIDTGEAIAGGDPDINLYAATESTGAQDAAVTGLTETQLCDSGDLAIGSRVFLTAFPAANQYLYMANGVATDAEYTAGMIIITLVGIAS